MSTNPTPKSDSQAAKRETDRRNEEIAGQAFDFPSAHSPVDSPSPELNELRRKKLIRHIERVQESCAVLGEQLIDQDKEHLGHQLIANSFLHDNSKFYGIEWLYLHDDVKQSHPNLFNAAWTHHIHTNLHHPEYWDGIERMPRLYLAEMICDWHARSSEFGSDLRNYIRYRATQRFDFDIRSRVFREIDSLVNLLLDPGFGVD